jgi:hypothetical protein
MIHLDRITYPRRKDTLPKLGIALPRAKEDVEPLNNGLAVPYVWRA